MRWSLPAGRPRSVALGPAAAVRSLYLDLQGWTHTEPERWARRVAPCPIRDEDMRWIHLRRRKMQSGWPTPLANGKPDRQGSGRVEPVTLA
jgi:hypothetical protein